MFTWHFTALYNNKTINVDHLALFTHSFWCRFYFSLIMYSDRHCCRHSSLVLLLFYTIVLEVFKQLSVFYFFCALFSSLSLCLFALKWVYIWASDDDDCEQHIKLKIGVWYYAQCVHCTPCVCTTLKYAICVRISVEFDPIGWKQIFFCTHTLTAHWPGRFIGWARKNVCERSAWCTFINSNMNKNKDTKEYNVRNHFFLFKIRWLAHTLHFFAFI